MYGSNTCNIHVLVSYDKKKMFVSSNLSYPLWHIVLLKVPHTISFKTLNIYIILHWVCVRKLIQDKWTDLLCIWWQDASHTEITCELELFWGCSIIIFTNFWRACSLPKNNIVTPHPICFNKIVDPYPNAQILRPTPTPQTHTQPRCFSITVIELHM